MLRSPIPSRLGCRRYAWRIWPGNVSTDLDELNLKLVNALNDDGRIYLTQTEHEGMRVIRFVVGQFDMEENDVDIAFDAIKDVAVTLA